MALVNVINMVVLDNPTNFQNPFQFEITFECLQELSDDLEWKVLYVGSANDASRDQTLDEILVGPIPVGVNKFVLQADAPDPSRLPPDEILGVTVVLVTCSYREREFVRVGYYVNNEYTDADYQQQLQQAQQAQQAQLAQLAQQDQQDGNTPATPPTTTVPLPKPPSWPNLDLSKVQRQILADKPRVTKFPIPWGDETTTTTGTKTDQQDNDQGMMDIAQPNNNMLLEQKQQQQQQQQSPTTTTAIMDVDMQQ